MHRINKIKFNDILLVALKLHMIHIRDYKDDIEKLQSKCCKYLLLVRSSTSEDNFSSISNWASNLINSKTSQLPTMILNWWRGGFAPAI